MAARATRDPVVFVIHDEPAVRSDIQAMLRTVHIAARLVASVSSFRTMKLPDTPSCLVCNVRLQDGDALDLQDELRRQGSKLPIIFITEDGTIEMAVRAMKAGASDFLRKPFRDQDLLDAIHGALEHDRQRLEAESRLVAIKQRVGSLSPRQRSVFQLLSDGRTTPEISAQLNLHRSTVRVFRHEVGTKLGVRTIRDLMRIGDVVFNRSPEGEIHASEF